MTLTAAEVLARVEQGESLESIVRSATPPAHAALRPRLAAVRSFDRDLFDAVLRLDPIDGETPTFEEIVDGPLVERLPAPEPVYRLTADARAEYLTGWWAGEPGTVPPPDLVDLSRRLVEYHEAKGDRLEALYHLVLVDRDAAHDLFGELYREADAGFDLARCQDIIDCIDEETRLPLVRGHPLAELLDQREVYLRARAAWSSDYYRTAYFLEPQGTRATFEAMLEGSAAPVLELHAPGGRGKTMQLRWLIARYCVPEPRRIPCARVDFDVIDPLTGMGSPWLIILEVAAQLNMQLPGKPFTELLSSYGRFTAVLRRAVTSGATALTSELDSPGFQDFMAEMVPSRVGATLAENSQGRPILLVFDTLEEVSLRPEASLDDLVRDLVQLRAACPHVRVVLSGRYPLLDRLRASPVTFPAIDSYEVQAFSSGEARRYLTEVRGIRKRKLVNAVVEKANGLPFKLALFADVLEQDRSLTAEKIQSYEDIDLLYLMERVINRIQDQRVRWLVRHGVVRRTLTPEFLAEVLRPSLVRAMRGDPDYDSPEDDKAWPVGIVQGAEDVDTDELWRKLRSYAFHSAWVSEDDRHPDALTFHPDVRDPMLRVMKRQRAFRALHGDAARHFEGKAVAEPQRWVEWTRESLFHRFQEEGSRAGRFWVAAMRRAQREARPEWRAEIAAAVLGPEFLGPTGAPLVGVDGAAIVSRRVVTRARFELARALADQAKAARAGSSHHWWGTARSELEVVVSAGSTGIVHPAELALLHADIRVADGRRDEAASTLRSALVGDAGPHRLTLRLAYADLLLSSLLSSDRSRPRREAEDQLTAALGEIPLDAHQARLPVLHRLSILHAYEDQVAAAQRECAEALEGAGDAVGPAMEGLRMLAVDLQFRQGRPFAAMELVRQCETGGHFPPHVVRRLLDEAALLSNDPLEVLEAPPEPVPAEGTSPGDDSLETAAERAEAVGRAFAQVMDVRHASSALEQAGDLWRRAGDVERFAKSLVLCADVHLRVSGNLRTAQKFVAQAERVQPTRGDEAWLRARLATIELLHRIDDGDQARLLFQETVSELKERAAPPRFLVWTCLEAMAQEVTPALLELLWENLSRVDDVKTRLALVGGLNRVKDAGPHVPGVHELWDALHLRTVGDPLLRGTSAHTAAETFDTALLALRLAEIERVAGRREQAAWMLRRALDLLDERQMPFGWLALVEWIRAAWRSAAPLPDDFFEGALALFSEYGLLCGALLVEAAEHRLEDGAPDEAGELLDRAMPLLDSTGIRTQWQARARLVGARRAGRADLAAVAATSASTIYADLGDRQAARLQAEPVTRAAEGRPRPDKPDAEPVTFVHRQLGLEGTPQRVRADFLRPADLAAGRARPDAGVRLAESVTSSDPSSPLPTGFLRWFAADHVAVMEELADVLALENELRALDSVANEIDVGLTIADPRLQALPWELAAFGSVRVHGIRALFRLLSSERTERERVRNVQLALGVVTGRTLPPDGVLGPATRSLLTDFQKSAGLPPTGIPTRATRGGLRWALREQSRSAVTVILALPSLRSERAQLRGSRVQGLNLEHLYQGAGFRTLVVEDASFATVERVLFAQSQATAIVLHLACGIRETLSGLALDSGRTDAHRPKMKGSAVPSKRGGAEDWEGERLTTTAVDRLLSLANTQGAPPIVVLDVPRPATPSEAVRAMLLRNLFAAELFGLGAASAVVATGLAGPAESERLYDQLIDVLARGLSLADAAAAVRRTAPDESLDSVLAFGALGLFAHDPELGLTPFPDRP